MGQEKEIPSGGRCSRGDYGSVQETLSAFSRSLVAFFKESCDSFQGIQPALSRNPVCLFKESCQPFQRIQSAFSRGFSDLAGALMTFTRGF